jgi:uncharacterized protein YdgA (DUF945 family)
MVMTLRVVRIGGSISVRVTNNNDYQPRLICPEVLLPVEIKERMMVLGAVDENVKVPGYGRRYEHSFDLYDVELIRNDDGVGVFSVGDKLHHVRSKPLRRNRDES